MIENFQDYKKKIEDRCFQRSYECIETSVQVINGREYQVEYYAEPHQDEYLLSELKDGEISGIVQLFKRGVLQLSWRSEGGLKVGGVTMYSDGKAECTMDWKFFKGTDLRALENTKRGLQLVISDPISGVAVYRGEYSENRELREGHGYVYDNKTGKVLYYGVFRNDQIYRYLQEFEGDKMIEYGEGEESNANLLDRSPIYVGGYIFDETTDTYKRNGHGNVIDPYSGLASEESLWENGVEKETPIHFTNGWYGPNEIIVQSLRVGERQESVLESKASEEPIVMSSAVVDDDNQSGSLPVEPIQLESIPHMPLIPGQYMPRTTEPDEPREDSSTHVYDSTDYEGMPVVTAIHTDEHEGMPLVPPVPVVEHGMPLVPPVPVVDQGMPEVILPIVQSVDENNQEDQDYEMDVMVVDPETNPEFQEMTESEENPLNNDQRIVIQRASDLNKISLTVVEFTVASGCCNESDITSVSLEVLKEVKSIRIGDECFMNLIGFRLQHMEKLEEFIVGKNSFTMKKNNQGERKDCQLIITDCNRLQEISIGAFSFSDYCSIELANLNVLKTLKIGEADKSFCFHNADFRVMNLHTLESIEFGNATFMNSHELSLESCMASLRSIVFHTLAFYGDMRKDRREGQNPNHFKNTVAFASLPSLEELTFEGRNFANFGMVRLESVPNVREIKRNDGNFVNVYHLQDKNADNLSMFIRSCTTKLGN